MSVLLDQLDRQGQSGSSDLQACGSPQYMPEYLFNPGGTLSVLYKQLYLEFKVLVSLGLFFSPKIMFFQIIHP